MSNSSYFYDITGTVMMGDNKTLSTLPGPTVPLGTPTPIILQEQAWNDEEPLKSDQNETVIPASTIGINFAELPADFGKQ
jgi:hypothetical protein